MRGFIPASVARTLIYVSLIGLIGAGCNSSAESGSSHRTTPIPASFPIPDPNNLPVPPASAQVNTVGPACRGDSSHECIGLKYVAYQNPDGSPVVTQTDAIHNVASINSVWKQCNITFQIDEFSLQDPRHYGLEFNTRNNSDLDVIRGNFSNDRTFLVVTTGTWNRFGTLGNTQANAWTNLPEDSVLGSVLEAPVGTYANIIAHELGHYMNLNHVSDASDLMNPVIYNYSVNLSVDQCNGARQAIEYYWTNMKR